MVLDLAVLARWDDGRGSTFCQPVAQGFLSSPVGDEFGAGGMASIQRWATLQSWTFPGVRSTIIPTTIAAFRRRFLDRIEGLFVEVQLLALGAGPPWC